MKLIDLTHEINPRMSVFPGTKLYTLEQTATYETNFYMEHKMTLTTHLGTHIDAPSHIIDGGKRLSELSVEAFVGNGIVMDVRNNREGITITELKNLPGINEIEFILFYTGHDLSYGTEVYLTDFPLLTSEATAYLVELSKKRLKGIGIDTLSIDPIDPPSIERHIPLLSAGLLIVENLTNLMALMDTTFIFQCLPLKMERIEGCPIRAIAMIL